MKNLKLITIFLLLASMILSVTACTLSEESADTSETVSDDESMSESEAESNVSEDASEAESEVEVSEDDTVFQINTKDSNGNHKIVSVDKCKGDKKLYYVMLSSSGSNLSDIFFNEYGLTFREALDIYGGYTESTVEYEYLPEYYERVLDDFLPLLPNQKEKVINEFIAKYNISTEDICDTIIIDFAKYIVDYHNLSFAPYYFGILIYLEEAEFAEINNKIDEDYYLILFEKNWKRGISINEKGVYLIAYPFDVYG